MEHWRGSHPGRERIFWSLRNKYSGFLNSSHRAGLVVEVVTVVMVEMEVRVVNVVVVEDIERVVEGGAGKLLVRQE